MRRFSGMTPRTRLACALVLGASLAASGCSRAAREAPSQSSTTPVVATAQAQPGQAATPSSLPSRKIIRRAELRYQAEDVAAAQRVVTAITEKTGGFIVSSDVRHDGEPGSRDDHTVATLVLRVPVDTFAATLDQIRAAAGRLDDEKVSGEDVTEQYVDLESRLKVQRVLEERLLSILKDARTVKDELEVEKQLSEVRGELERLEGRRRLLADQTSLSTITVTVSRRMPIALAQTTFSDSIRAAMHDAVSVAFGLTTGAIRLLGVVLPIAVLVVLPGYLVARLVQRRRKTLIAQG